MSVRRCGGLMTPETHPPRLGRDESPPKFIPSKEGWWLPLSHGGSGSSRRSSGATTRSPRSLPPYKLWQTPPPKYLHDPPRVHPDHDADAAEGRVLLLVVADVAEGRAPRKEGRGGSASTPSSPHCWGGEWVHRDTPPQNKAPPLLSPGPDELLEHGGHLLRADEAQAADGDGWRGHRERVCWLGGGGPHSKEQPPP